MRKVRNLSAKLLDLVRQIATARGELAELESKIDAARRKVSGDLQINLVEVNERLIEAAMEHQASADSALQALDALARSAQLDPLTQLPNRAMMLDRFRQAISMAKRHRQRLAVLFIDVDGFKNINDTLGHAIGDDVLRQIATRLVGSVRDVDTVSRHGGDEFLILLTEVAHRTDALNVANKVSQIAANAIVVGAHSLHMRLSIGICFYPQDGTEPDQLIKCADAAMYRDKRLHRGKLTATAANT